MVNRNPYSFLVFIPSCIKFRGIVMGSLILSSLVLFDVHVFMILCFGFTKNNQCMQKASQPFKNSYDISQQLCPPKVQQIWCWRNHSFSLKIWSPHTVSSSFNSKNFILCSHLFPSLSAFLVSPKTFGIIKLKRTSVAVKFQIIINSMLVLLFADAVLQRANGHHQSNPHHPRHVLLRRPPPPAILPTSDHPPEERLRSHGSGPRSTQPTFKPHQPLLPRSSMSDPAGFRQPGPREPCY